MFWRKCGKRSARSEKKARIEHTLEKQKTMRAKICKTIPPGVKRFVIFRPF